MVNANSHRHGLHAIKDRSPKSKLRNRRNKENARPGALARQTALREAMLAGNK